MISSQKNEIEHWHEGISEMEGAIERLRKEIQWLMEERDALEQGNLERYQQLTQRDLF